MASNLLWEANFEAGNLNEFSDTSQANWIVDSGGRNHVTGIDERTGAPFPQPPGNITVDSTIVREGTKSARIELRYGDEPSPYGNPNGEARNLIVGLPGKGPFGSDRDPSGTERWLRYSLYIPIGNPIPTIGWWALGELHQGGRVDGGVPNSGPAPFNMFTLNGHWNILIRGVQGNPVSGTFFQTEFDLTVPSTSHAQSWTPPYSVPSRVLKTVPFTLGVWHDWFIGEFLSGSSTVGWVEVWHGLAGIQPEQVLARSNAPTWYEGHAGGIFINQYREGYRAVNAGTSVVYYDKVQVWDGPPPELSLIIPPLSTPTSIFSPRSGSGFALGGSSKRYRKGF